LPQTERKAVLVATLAAPLPEEPEWRDSFLRGVRRWAEVLEVRADLVGEPDPATLRESFDGRLLYTLRSRHEGGAFDGSPERRHERLIAAAAAYDLVDLEASRDLVPEVLEAIAADRRIVSWHGPPAELIELEERFAAIARTPALLYKMVVLATTPSEAVAPLLLAAAVGRADLLAFAAGRAGAWTRFIAARYGAAVLYGAAAPASPGAPGQLTIEELVTDYGLPDLPPVRAFYGIVGRPVVSSSLSPRLHNGAYRELGIPAAFLPFEAEALGDFWLDVIESDLFRRLGRHLLGLAVTVPFKRSALAVAGAMSPRVECIGAANTLTLTEGVWEAENTDPEGILGPLAEHGVDVAGARAAVLGCGGAGRSAAFCLARAGAEVTLVNRGAERGEEAAEQLGLPFLPLDRFEPRDWDLVVHATPLGKHTGDPLPFAVERLRAEAVVVDMVYRRKQPTPLVEAVRENGGVAIDGREVLVHQALEQFRLMTGRELTVEMARRILDLETPEAVRRRRRLEAAERVEDGEAAEVGERPAEPESAPAAAAREGAE
jgi:3-dehydroquinate dehydratase/shikimate dehydrogenase